MRLMAGLTTRELARKAGLRPRRLLALERGAEPTPEEVDALAAVLDIPPIALTDHTPLPIPTSHDLPLDAEDDLLSLALLYAEVSEALDRRRQASTPEDWQEAWRRIRSFLPWLLPPPVPRRWVYVSPAAPVRLLTDWPMRLSAPQTHAPIHIHSPMGEHILTSSRSVEVPPGPLTLEAPGAYNGVRVWLTTLAPSKKP